MCAQSVQVTFALDHVRQRMLARALKTDLFAHVMDIEQEGMEGDQIEYG